MKILNLKAIILSFFIFAITDANAQDERCRETTGPQQPRKIRTFECKVKRIVSPENELDELKKVVKEKREEVAGFISTLVFVISELSVSQSGKATPIENFKHESGNLSLQEFEYKFETRRNQDSVEWTIHFSIDESEAKKKFDQFMSKVAVNHSAFVLADLKKQLKDVNSGNDTGGMNPMSLNPCDIEFLSKFKKADEQLLEHGEAFERQSERLQLLQSSFLLAQRKFARIIGPENNDDTDIEGKKIPVRSLKQFLNLRNQKLNPLKADPVGYEYAWQLFETPESTPFGLKGSSALKAYEKYINSNLQTLAKEIDVAMGVSNKWSISSDIKLTVDDHAGLKVARLCFHQNKIESKSKSEGDSDFNFELPFDACHDFAANGKTWDPYEWIQQTKATTNNYKGSTRVMLDGLSRVLAIKKQLDCESSFSELNARGLMRSIQLNLADQLPGLRSQLSGIRLTANQFQQIFEKDFTDFTKKNSLPKLDTPASPKAGSSRPRNADRLHRQIERFHDKYLVKWKEYLLDRYGKRK